jgi:hypothetical protein
MRKAEIDDRKRARLMDIARRVAARAPFADAETARAVLEEEIALALCELYGDIAVQ